MSSLDLGELRGSITIDTSQGVSALRDLNRIVAAGMADIDKTAELGGKTAGQSAGAGITQGVRSSAQDTTRAVQQATTQWQTATSRGGRTAGTAGGSAIAQGVRSGAQDTQAAVKSATAQWDTATRSGGRAAGAAGGDAITQGVRSGVQDTQSAVRSAASGWDTATRTAGASAGEAGGSSLVEHFKDKLGELRGSLTETLSGAASELGGAGGAGFAAAGVAAGGLLVKGVTDAISQGNIPNELQAELGLTKTTAQAAGKAAGALFGQGYGTGMDDIQGAVKSVIQNIDGMRTASQDTLQAVSGDALTLSQVFGTDVEDSTRAVSQMMRTGLAPNAQYAFDVITKGMQDGVNKSDDFLDTLNEYGTQFRKLGINGATATGILRQGLQGGARDADLVADAVKEFSIRAVDGSQSTADGFKLIGLNASDMQTKIAAGGDTAKGAFTQVLDGLRAIPDPATRSKAAVELFGTQAEDLGNALYSIHPDTAAAGLGKIAGATEKANKAMNATPSAKLSTFLRGLQQEATNVLGGTVIPLAGRTASALSSITSAAGTVGHAAASGIGMIPAPVQNAALAFGALTAAQKVFGSQITAIQGRVSGVVSSVTGLGASYRTAATSTRALESGQARLNTAGGAAVRTANAGTIAMGRFGTSIAAVGQNVPAVARAQSAFVGAAAGAERFPRAAGAARAGMSLASSAASGLSAALGGPVGVATVAVVAGSALSKLGTETENYGRSTAQLHSDLVQTTSTGADTSHMFDDLQVAMSPDKTYSFADGIKAINGHMSKLEMLREKGNTGFGMFGTGAQSDVDAMKARLVSVGQTLASMVQQGHSAEAAQIFAGLAKQANAAGMSTDQLKKLMPAYTSAVTEAGAKSKDAAVNASAYSKAQSDLQRATTASTKAQNTLKSALDAASNAFLDGRASESQYKESLAGITDALSQNGRTLDMNTEKGRANNTALDQLTTSGVGYLKGLQEQGASSTRISGATDQLRQSIIKSAETLGYSYPQAAAYAKSALGSIPTKVHTAVTADTKTAQAAAHALGIDFNKLPKSVQTQVIAAHAGAAQNAILGVYRATTQVNGKQVVVQTSVPNAGRSIQWLSSVRGARVAADGTVTIPTGTISAAQTTQLLNTVQGARKNADGSVTIPTSAPGAPNAAGDLNRVTGAANGIPANKHTAVTADTGGALNAVNNFVNGLAWLHPVIHVASVVSPVGSSIWGALTGHAGGGPGGVPGFAAGGGLLDVSKGGRLTGPGTPTSDSILSIGAAGRPYATSTTEHVWSAAEVAGAGGHGVQAQMRAMARDGSLRKTLAAVPAYAGGGSVTARPARGYGMPAPRRELNPNTTTGTAAVSHQQAQLDRLTGAVQAMTDTLPTLLAEAVYAGQTAKSRTDLSRAMHTAKVGGGRW